MKTLSLLTLLLFCIQQKHPSAYTPNFIDPTGTYTLKGNVKNNNITGHFGELRVHLLDSQTVAFCFYLSNGYPTYAAATILDTLQYSDNFIKFRPKGDSSCSLILTFSARSVELMKVYSDPSTGCGFTPGIIVPVVLNKTSSAVPVIQDFATGGR